MQLANCVAIITGGGRGIGRAIAEACAHEGARVAITGRTAWQLREAADSIRKLGADVEALVSDVTDKGDVSRSLDAVLRKWGTVDLLVNNAGSFSAIGPVWDSDTDAWWRDVKPNLFGTHLWCNAVIPHLLKHGAGRIVNLIGGGTYGPLEYGSGYGASKAALMRYTETLAVELADTPIAVFAMDPGLVKTEMVERIVGSEPGKRWFGWMKGILDEGKDAPATAAASIVTEIATGRLDLLKGRAVFYRDDLAELEGSAKRISDSDSRTLRMVP